MWKIPGSRSDKVFGQPWRPVSKLVTGGHGSAGYDRGCRRAFYRGGQSHLGMGELWPFYTFCSILSFLYILR